MKLFTLFFIFCLSASAQDLRVQLSGTDLIIPKLGSREPLPSHQRFTPFIKNYFNRPGLFFGPNCYNTALIASGYFQENIIRYVSPDEFEEILKTSFKQVSTPTYKDIIVFDAKASRGHVAFYLGDDLIFHKKSFSTQYFYRMTTVENAGVVEENEWTPGPNDDPSSQMNLPDLGKLPKAYFRLFNKSTPVLDPKMASLIKKIESLLLKDLGSWSIARNWGMTGEYLLEDMLMYAKKSKMNPYTIAVLTSLKDQIYIMLEEVNFKNSRNPTRVLREICIPEKKEQLFELVMDFGRLMGHSHEKIKTILLELESQDTSRCNYRPVLKLI